MADAVATAAATATKPRPRPNPGKASPRKKADGSAALKEELKQLRADYQTKVRKIRREILLKKAEELK